MTVGTATATATATATTTKTKTTPHLYGAFHHKRGCLKRRRPLGALAFWRFGVLAFWRLGVKQFAADTERQNQNINLPISIR
jgi:hypothetical protein